MSAKSNEIVREKFSAWKVLIRQFKNPLLLVFIIATIVSYALGQRVEATVIWIVMALSISLGFFNEFQAEKIVNDLKKKITFYVEIVRDGTKQIIPVKDVRVGDNVIFNTGAVVPADIKLSSSVGLSVNESVLTGESLPVDKKEGDTVFMGTVITGGNGEGIVVGIGSDTKFGKISESLTHTRPQSEFQKGLGDFSLLLTKIAGVTVFLVIVLGWFLHHPVIETALFALTVAMGITPELLPLIVTIGLSLGAKRLAKKSVVVKRFVSIEDLGNMEVLCTDKTGTLTEGKIKLDKFVNIGGKPDPGVLELSMICNSGFGKGDNTSDSIDGAILDFAKKQNFIVSGQPKKIFTVPFNFENRFMSTVINWKQSLRIICKGSPEEVIEKCSLSLGQQEKLLQKVHDMQKDGLRVVAIASKDIKEFDPKIFSSQLTGLSFEGLLGFLDIPKKNLVSVFEKFRELGVKIKIVTGDSDIVAEKVSVDVGFNYKKVITGKQIEKMNDTDLQNCVWDTDIFARVTPSQKMRIIESLKKGGHTVGFLGDGVNDGPALHSCDAGISVNSGVDVAKDAASIVLLHKSLGVIADGIKEGRITFQNTIKYILMGTSSDFGNMISAAAASVFLPFLPMAPVQVLLTDVLYDVSQVAIPSDNVDHDQIKMPKNWDINYIKRFMLLFGPISTLYDFLTFGLMYFVFHATGSLFQTGWFVESLITEILVVFVIRTRKVPFWKSRAGNALIATCLSVVVIGIVLPFSPFAKYLAFTPLPLLFFVFLIGITLTYLVLVEMGMKILNKYEINSSKS